LPAATTEAGDEGGAEEVTALPPMGEWPAAKRQAEDDRGAAAMAEPLRDMEVAPQPETQAARAEADVVPPESRRADEPFEPALEPPPLVGIPRLFPWPRAVPALIFALLTVFMFLDVLFDREAVLGSITGDMALQFIPWRTFGFAQMRQGNLALWNPHIFGGAPFFAGFQSALLYPPNWLHLVMPVGLAINWIIALHVFLAGMFMYAWVRHRGLSRGAGVLAGVMYMFCGPYFPHIFAGHLPHLALMPWVPLLFLAIDGAIEEKSPKWPLLGIFALAMIVLAGHPQYVYYTAIVAAVYTVLNLVVADNPARALLACVVIVAGGIAISAVQLLPGYDLATSEAVRAGATSSEFAKSFSFPPENLLTLIAPNVFGSFPHFDNAPRPEFYWGRAYAWEISAFASLTGFILGVYGAIVSEGRTRRFAVTTAIVAAVLAMGAHVPLLYRVLAHLPMYAQFRGTTKFMFLAVMFLCVLAGIGFDALLRRRRIHELCIGIGGGVLVIVILALVIRTSSAHGTRSLWGTFARHTIEAATDANEMFYNPVVFGPQFVRESGDIAFWALLKAAVLSLVVLVLIILAATWRPVIAYGLIVIAILELFVNAVPSRATMTTDLHVPPPWEQALNQLPPDGRVLFGNSPSPFENYGMVYGFNSLWGYDPAVLLRYAQVIGASQGVPMDKVSQNIAITRVSPGIFRMLRTSLVLLNNPKQPVGTFNDALPTAVIVPRAAVVPNRAELMALLVRDTFDPRALVLLERPPAIEPNGASIAGTVQVLGRTTDVLELEANLPAPGLLLVTNNYAKGWQVEPVTPPPPGQKSYEIVPADWTLQGIPLAAGSHHLRLVYSPVSYRIGAWVTGISLVAYVAALILFIRRRWAPLTPRQDAAV
jgi:hypothetical protein